MKRYMYEKLGGAPQGPCDVDNLRQLAAEGLVSLETRVAEEGTDAWQPLANVLHTATAAQAKTVAPNAQSPPTPATSAPAAVAAPAAPDMASRPVISNWAVGLLIAAILLSAFLIAYKPGVKDPPEAFRSLALRKRAKLKQFVVAQGGHWQDDLYDFDVERTKTELSPFVAHITASMQWGGGMGALRAIYLYKDRRWQYRGLELRDGAGKPIFAAPDDKKSNSIREQLDDIFR